MRHLYAPPYPHPESEITSLCAAGLAPNKWRLLVTVYDYKAQGLRGRVICQDCLDRYPMWLLGSTEL